MKNFVSKALWLFKKKPKEAIYCYLMTASTDREIMLDGHITIPKIDSVETMTEVRAYLKQHFVDSCAGRGIHLPQGVKNVAMRSFSYVGDVHE